MNLKNNIKEFIVTQNLTYNNKPVGYKGFIMIDGKKSDTVDITITFMTTIQRDYGFILRTENTKGNIEMVREGSNLYSDKDCPILQPFNIYKMLGFNDYKRNDKILQDLSRELSDKYFNGFYRNVIIIKDASLNEHIRYRLLNKDAIEITINSRTTKNSETNYLLHILIAIDTYFKTGGSMTEYTNNIIEFNNENSLSVPLTRKFTIDKVRTNYECTKCKKVIESDRKFNTLKNYRCKCSGTLKNLEV